MRVTLAQIDARLGDLDGNVERAAAVVSSAAAAGTDLIIFPELSLTGYSVTDMAEPCAVPADDPRLRAVAERAGDAAVVLGFVERDPAALHDYNSSAYFEAGRLVHVHRKLYLPTYSVFEERKVFSPGQTMRAFPVAGTGQRMAILTCNDAWQPQLAFLATQDGAQVLIVPAASSQNRTSDRYDSQTYWRDISTFYARMFQLYVVFVNRVGTEGGLRFWGGSHVVDPWGEVTTQAALGEEDVVTVDVDLAQISRRRREIPLVREARLGLIEQEIHRLLEDGGDR
jgi:predicted amidohydrolase